MSANASLSANTGKEPSIVSVKPYAVYSGSNESAAFDVDLISDSTVVEKVDLFLVPDLRRWTVTSPSTGRYTMYDHIGDYDRGSHYYFVFTKKNGTTVKTDTFMIP
jgi:hypothetical protein